MTSEEKQKEEIKKEEKFAKVLQDKLLLIQEKLLQLEQKIEKAAS